MGSYVSTSTDLVAHSGRFQLAMDDLNYHSARFTPDVSKDKAESTVQDADKHSDLHLFDEDDLVARLMNDENAIWEQLLANPFCTEMKTAKKGDTKVETAFKTYMIQDFLYCGRVLLYHTERSLKAPDQLEYKNLTGKISSNAEYSVTLLETCIGKLGLEGTTVLHTSPAKATTDYKNFVVEVAEEYDWVASLVAMVPCIQSYYHIAVKIRDHKPAPDKSTLWYINWVDQNLKYESSTTKQIKFFKDHAKDWKKTRYDDLRKIFRDACQKEIDLWAVAKST